MRFRVPKIEVLTYIMLYVKVLGEKKNPFGCSFRMPVGARRRAPTSQRYFLFFFFFLRQGAFLLSDGNATHWTASVHTAHMSKPVM